MMKKKILKHQDKLINNAVSEAAKKLLENKSNVNIENNINYKIKLSFKDIKFLRKVLNFAYANFSLNDDSMSKNMVDTINKILIETSIYNTFFITFEQYDLLVTVIKIFYKVSSKETYKLEERLNTIRKQFSLKYLLIPFLYIQKVILTRKYKQLLKLYSIIKYQKVII